MGPLQGLTIIEITGIGPGPFAAMLLADMGADVIRVERPGGSMFTAAHNPKLDFLNRNKRCISIDLKNAAGVDTVLTLLEKADALFAKNNLFHPELNDLKKRILDDITDVNVSYWEDAPTIRQELDKILTRKWAILSEADLGVIRIRRAQFDDPEKNGIQYNARSGEE